MENENKPQSIDYYIYENEMFRMERHVKRWMIAFWIVFASLVASNLAWIWYENQFEDEITVTQDVEDGNNNYIGNNGDITNGTSKADDNKTP